MTARLPATGALAGFKPWTAADDSALAAAYSLGGIYAAMRALPNRSRSALFHRAQRLAKRRGDVNLKRRLRWSPADDANLEALWGTMALQRIAKKLNRTPAALYVRAQTIGLQLGCQQGDEYLRHAADRTGFSSGELRRILKAAGVGLRLSMSRPNDGKHRFHTVDPKDVDDAVRAWLATELVHRAAESRGLVGETLRDWLLAALARGVDMPEPPKIKKGRWRVPSSVIDAVIAWQQARESLSAASLRTGVGRSQLRRWLVEAGVAAGRKKPWLLEKVAVDRVVSERRTKEAA